MNTIIFVSLIFAILSPIFLAVMNIVDKYLVSHRIKNVMGFSVVSAITSSLIGLVFGLFLNWEGLVFSDFIIPIIVGLLMGSNYFLYYLIIKKEDASNMTGLIYFYPVLVAIFSFLFLHEVLSLISYLGVILIIIGVLLLSVRMKHLKMTISLWIIFLSILIVAIDEFLIKIYTNNLPELNGIAINIICICIPAILAILFNKKLRISFISEVKNTKWAFLSETFTFLGIFALYFSMQEISVTIVSSIAAIQPLILLGFENIAQRVFGKMTKDKLILPKLIAIILIVLGVVTLYLKEIINSLKT